MEKIHHYPKEPLTLLGGQAPKAIILCKSTVSVPVGPLRSAVTVFIINLARGRSAQLVLDKLRMAQTRECPTSREPSKLK